MVEVKQQNSYNGLRIAAVIALAFAMLFKFITQIKNIVACLQMLQYFMQPAEQMRTFVDLLISMLHIFGSLVLVGSGAMLFLKQRRYLIIPFAFLLYLNLLNIFVRTTPALILTILASLAELLFVIAVQSKSVHWKKVFQRIWWLPALLLVVSCIVDILYVILIYHLNSIPLEASNMVMLYWSFVLATICGAVGSILYFLYLKQTDKYQLQQLQEASLSVN